MKLPAPHLFQKSFCSKILTEVAGERWEVFLETAIDSHHLRKEQRVFVGEFQSVSKYPRKDTALYNFIIYVLAMIRQAIRLDIRGLPSFGTRRRPNRLLRASQSYISRSSHLVISELFSSNSAFLPLPKLDVCHFSSTVKPTTKKGRRKYVPRKAAVELTEKARAFFKR